MPKNPYKISSQQTPVLTRTSSRPCLQGLNGYSRSRSTSRIPQKNLLGEVLQKESALDASPHVCTKSRDYLNEKYRPSKACKHLQEGEPNTKSNEARIPINPVAQFTSNKIFRNKRDQELNNDQIFLPRKHKLMDYILNRPRYFTSDIHRPQAQLGGAYHNYENRHTSSGRGLKNKRSLQLRQSYFQKTQKIYVSRKSYSGAQEIIQKPSKVIFSNQALQGREYGSPILDKSSLLQCCDYSTDNTEFTYNFRKKSVNSSITLKKKPNITSNTCMKKGEESIQPSKVSSLKDPPKSTADPSCRIDIKFLRTNGEIPLKLELFKSKRPSYSSLQKLKAKLNPLICAQKEQEQSLDCGLTIKNKILNEAKILLKKPEKFKVRHSKFRNLKSHSGVNKSVENQPAKRLNLDLDL
ncbi:unnamed protein product [Moneuplotes crassus]|uniref:Uncharacterized protein n=1 Tax=Euplotes crassus TaxID=5936 RepID=A0AAD1YAW2_EUPCR|nr:unnamed protein product [Moneuplotes crassus]